MPVYQYACTECGEELEARQSFTDDALTVCPVCSGRLRKVLTAVGVVFKGSGFYRNDSRASASQGGSGTSTPSGDKPSAGSDSAPAAKPGGESGADKGAAAKSSDSASGSNGSGSKSGSGSGSGKGAVAGSKPAAAAAR